MTSHYGVIYRKWGRLDEAEAKTLETRAMADLRVFDDRRRPSITEASGGAPDVSPTPIGVHRRQRLADDWRQARRKRFWRSL